MRIVDQYTNQTAHSGVLGYCRTVVSASGFPCGLFSNPHSCTEELIPPPPQPGYIHHGNHI